MTNNFVTDKGNLTDLSMSSYHPHVTHIGEDWVPNEGTVGDLRLEGLSSSSFELDDL